LHPPINRNIPIEEETKQKQSNIDFENYDPSVLNNNSLYHSDKIIKSKGDGSQTYTPVEPKENPYIDNPINNNNVITAPPPPNPLPKVYPNNIPYVDYGQQDYSTNIPNKYNDRINVRGYYRKDGTYVRPHTRSRPN
jgi:hypothetical protein